MSSLGFQVAWWCININHCSFCVQWLSGAFWL